MVLLPSDDLATSKTSACKVVICILKNERMREKNDMDENSKESDDKHRGNNDTKEDIKALGEELKGIFLGDRQIQIGVVCGRCQNLEHYVQKFQLK